MLVIVCNALVLPYDLLFYYPYVLYSLCIYIYIYWCIEAVYIEMLPLPVRVASTGLKRSLVYEKWIPHGQCYWEGEHPFLPWPRIEVTPHLDELGVGIIVSFQSPLLPGSFLNTCQPKKLMIFKHAADWNHFETSRLWRTNPAVSLI